jgi:hypothetical protein
MKIKTYLMVLFSLVLFGNLISGVSALGLTPARTTLDFQPGLEIERYFTVINSDGKDMDIIIYAQGELAKNIYFIENSFSVSAEEDSKKFNFKLKLPANLDPGLNSGEIVVMELPKKSGSSEAFVGATLAVVHQVHVYVKYPGKYADVDLNIVDANQNEDVVFVIPVFSRGEHDLVSVRANIDIYNRMNEKITSFNSADISVNSGEKKDLVHKWKAEVPVGNYFAKVAVVYDGETKNLERPFRVGIPELEVQSIEVKNFRLGEIAKFEMLIESKWSEPIVGAHTQMQIFDNNNNLISEIKSASYDFDPISKKVLVSYWDTAGVREGDYQTKLFLNYGDKSVQKNIELKVSKDRIRVVGVGYVISPEEGTDDKGLIIGLIIGVIILIGINIFWFMVLRKRLKGK